MDPVSTTGAPGDAPEDFVLLVRDALAHLYDFAHLERHPLLALAAGSSGDAGKALRALLLDTLEQLNPGDAVSHNDKAWRPYGILTRRYVDGFTIEEIMAELGISLRQFQRDHRKGLLGASAMLWRSRGGAWRDTPPAALPSPSNLQQEMERIGVTLEWVDLGALVESVLPPARALAQGCGVRLEAPPPGRPVAARADALLARQALLGALSALATARPRRLSLSWRRARGSALLELTVQPPLAGDGSCGAPGLDARLAATAELVHAQGGRLEVVRAASGLRAVQIALRPAEGRRILLVDDNESLLQLFERYLAAEGYTVGSAANVEAALEAIAQERPDAIVLDVMMRNVDGWQLLQQLHADPDLQEVPILVCSVLNEPELAHALGARRYLKKPVTQRQLLAALQEALDGNSPAAPHPGGP